MSSVRNKLIWSVAAVGAAAAGFLLFVRPRHLVWGTSSGECSETLAGDEFIDDAEMCATHAITIDAPPEHVWPWIAQIGQNKGGFYSYTALENLVGCEMRNADEVHPEWQSLKVGDSVVFHPKFPAQPVVRLKEYEHMVIGANLGQEEESTWAFVLRDLGNGRTRFIVRLRARSHKGFGRLADVLLLEPAHFVMERKMMLTIKKLAEQRGRRTRAA